MRFNAKVSAIEEMANLKDLKMDQLYGTLTSYEMRVGREKYELKEEAFKVSKNSKELNNHQNCSSCESDQELAQLDRKMKRGLGNIKGIFHLGVLTMEELDIYRGNALIRKRLKRKRIRNLETSLRHIRRKIFLRRMGSTPKSVGCVLYSFHN